MAIETERKFLVKGEFRHLSTDETEIVQTYLSTDPQRIVRLRIAGNDAFLTIKTMIREEPISRKEWEMPLNIEFAREIMEVCLPGKIVKTRYHVPSGNHNFEVDVFHDKNEGLIIAEIELSHPDEHFTIPDWLGREVTGDPGYYNSNLIK